MKVTDTGVPVDSLIDAVQTAVREAGISSVDADRALRVTEIQLTLNAVATRSAGANVEFKIPFIGMNISFGSTVTTQDTHTIDITLVPPDLAPTHEIRDGDIDLVLVEAIETITTAMTRAASGDDPFVLKTSTIELAFAVTGDGSISLGIEGDTKDEVTHRLRITLAPTAPGS